MLFLTSFQVKNAGLFFFQLQSDSHLNFHMNYCYLKEVNL